jgi:hypothetical protein
MDMRSKVELHVYMHGVSSFDSIFKVRSQVITISRHVKCNILGYQGLIGGMNRNAPVIGVIGSMDGRVPEVAVSSSWDSLPVNESASGIVPIQ